jgi:hypothetical protein
VVDYVPPRFRGLRRAVEKRADSWYSKRLAAPFLAGWLAAKELEDEHLPVDRYDDVASALLAQQRWLGDVLPLVPRGAAILAIACSHTIGRELIAAGYRLTFAASDADLDASFDVALAFRVDLAVQNDGAAEANALLDFAEHHSGLVAATFELGAGCERDVRRRAERHGVALELHDPDGTALVVYRTDRPLTRVDQPLPRRLREAAARLAARRLGRRRPWEPSVRR